MLSKPGPWWRIWMTITVIWTVVIAGYGWTQLPQARNIAHEARFMVALSPRALSILAADDAPMPAVASGLVWTRKPVMVRMSNGAAITFPSIATGRGISLVQQEYAAVLAAEASARRARYVLEISAAWLLPCLLLLVTGLVADMIYRGRVNVLPALLDSVQRMAPRPDTIVPPVRRPLQNRYIRHT